LTITGKQKTASQDADPQSEKASGRFKGGALALPFLILSLKRERKNVKKVYCLSGIVRVVYRHCVSMFDDDRADLGGRMCGTLGIVFS